MKSMAKLTLRLRNKLEISLEDFLTLQMLRTNEELLHYHLGFKVSNFGCSYLSKFYLRLPMSHFPQMDFNPILRNQWHDASNKSLLLLPLPTAACYCLRIALCCGPLV